MICFFKIYKSIATKKEQVCLLCQVKTCLVKSISLLLSAQSSNCNQLYFVHITDARQDIPFSSTLVPIPGEHSEAQLSTPCTLCTETLQCS